MSADIDEAAARWHLAQADGDMDWSAFTDWLEADPRHRAAYDAIALLDARIDAVRPALARQLDDMPPEPTVMKASGALWRRMPRLAAWGALAAVLVMALLVGIQRWPQADTPTMVVHRAPLGRTLEVKLTPGATAVLAPGSALQIATDRDTPMLLTGTALFDVRHGAAAPLKLRAGGYEIRDIGTTFEVAAGGEVLRVAVEQGKVAVRAPGAGHEVMVDAGHALIAVKGAGGQLRAIGATPVGDWRDGALRYEDVPLALVVADIARTSGQPVTIAPDAAQRRFSGVIAPGNGAAMAASLGALTGLAVRKDGDAIRIGDRTGG